MKRFVCFLSVFLSCLILGVSVGGVSASASESIPYADSFYSFYTVSNDTGFDSYLCYSRSASNSYMEVVYYNSSDPITLSDKGQLQLCSSSSFHEIYKVDRVGSDYVFTSTTSVYRDSGYNYLIDLSRISSGYKHTFLCYSSRDIYVDGFDECFFTHAPLRGQFTLLQRLCRVMDSQLQQQTIPAVRVIVMIAVVCLALLATGLILLPKILRRFGLG